MDGLYFLAMLGGIAWLAWWSVGGAGWSPFAMREVPTDDPTVELHHPLSEPSRAQPWRLRGKPPAPSRRQR
jgi:hypothetical protein